MPALCNNIPGVHYERWVPGVGVTGVGCRVPGCRVMALFGHCSRTVLGTGPGTTLGPSLPYTGLTAPPIYALAPTRVPRAFRTDPGTHLPPGYTPPPATAVPATSAVPAVLPRCRRCPWGSLLAAPLARLLGHVTWPSTRTLYCPLIGTHCHAPCVTRDTAIMANSVICTLLWSTLWCGAHAVLFRPDSKPRYGRYCHY